MMPPIVSLTSAALDRAKYLLTKGGDETIIGLRVGVANKGCSGMSYRVEYASEAKKFEEIIEQDGVKIFIDPAAVMFLIGSTIDYQETALKSGFTFTNPNEASRCGCGESFAPKPIPSQI